MRRAVKLYFIPTLVVSLTLLAAILYSPSAVRKDINPVLANHTFIGHAFGSIDGYTYTNSLEAFKTNYDKGRRVFEVDFSVTSDGVVVCFHPGKEPMYGLKKYIWYTQHREFMESKILGRYTPMDIFELVRIMREYKDIYIVTDVKGPASVIARVHKLLVLETRNSNSEMTERIIPQVYDEKTYYQTMEFYPFAEVIYTLYRTNSSDAEVVDFLRQHKNITALTVSTQRFNPALAKAVSELGRLVYVHTINNPQTMNNYRKKGAFGFYTDSYFGKLGT